MVSKLSEEGTRAKVKEQVRVLEGSSGYYWNDQDSWQEFQSVGAGDIEQNLRPSRNWEVTKVS